jgi:hypothetical protein
MGRRKLVDPSGGDSPRLLVNPHFLPCTIYLPPSANDDSGAGCSGPVRVREYSYMAYRTAIQVHERPYRRWYRQYG